MLDGISVRLAVHNSERMGDRAHFLRTSSLACASYSSSDVCSAKVKFVGVQVFSGFLSVIVVQQVCRDFIVGWTYSTQNELAFLSSLCAVKRRAGICRPMQVTVRIRVSTARDEQDWQGHQR